MLLAGTASATMAVRDAVTGVVFVASADSLPDDLPPGLYAIMERSADTTARRLHVVAGDLGPEPVAAVVAPGCEAPEEVVDFLRWLAREGLLSQCRLVDGSGPIPGDLPVIVPGPGCIDALPHHQPLLVFTGDLTIEDAVGLQDCSVPERFDGYWWDIQPEAFAGYAHSRDVYWFVDRFIGQLDWSPPAPRTTQPYRIYPSRIPLGYAFETGQAQAFGLGEELFPWRVGTPLALLRRGAPQRFWAGIAGWGRLLAQGDPAVVTLTRFLLAEVGFTPGVPNRASDSRPAPQYGGLYETLHTAEVGGVISYIAYRPPSWPGETFHVDYEGFDDIALFSDLGEDTDVRAGDGFASKSFYAPPSDRAMVTRPTFRRAGSDDVPWPLLRVEGPKGAGRPSLGAFIRTDFDPSVVDRVVHLPFPPVSLSFLGLYQANFGGRPIILVAGTSHRRVAPGDSLLFQAAIAHTYGREKVRHAVVFHRDQRLFELNDDGRWGDPIAGDGVFSRGFALSDAAPAGDYRLTLKVVDVDGKEADPWPEIVTHAGRLLRIPEDGVLPGLRAMAPGEAPTTVREAMTQRGRSLILPLLVGLGLFLGVLWQSQRRKT